MKSFLSHVANYLNNKHQSEFQNVVVIMPNRRSCLYLESELASLINKPAWMPQIISLKDWLYSKSSLTKIEELIAIVKLYNVFRKVYPERNISFDEFYYTGQILLNDFNDIDSELVDAEKLFVNLMNLKEISDRFAFDEEFYNILSVYIRLFEKDLSLNNKDKESNIHSFIKIWQGLFELYNVFRNELIIEKQAYDGLLIRFFIENEYIQHSEIKNEVFYIVGFNALSRAEEKLFDILQNSTVVYFLWEYDDEYIKNEQYSAGLYLRKLIQKYPAPLDFNLITSNIKNADIKIFALPNEISMAKYAASKISCSNEKIALVLVDESLLPVVLNSLPKDIERVNVTMGFPIKYTNTFTIIKQLFKLRQQIRKSIDRVWIPRNVWIELLYHPFIFDDKYVQDQIDDFVKKNNKPFAFIDFNSEIFKEIPDESVLLHLYQFCDNISNNLFFNLLIQLLQNIEAKMLKKDIEVVDIQLEIQTLRKVHNAFSAFNDLLQNNKIEIYDDRLFNKLINQVLQNLKIDLCGEPLEGLQIMGLMESRLLDFDKVYILSLNDKIIPGDKFTPTFILYSLRKYFGLTTPEKREAIDAFHFYRLIQRSSESYLFYSQFIGSEEADKSPYLRQLLFNKKWNISEKIFNDKMGQSPENRSIEIDKKLLGIKWENFIKNILEKGLSQKNISLYIQCPLKFYFEQVEGVIDEQLFPDESIDKDLGLIFHDAIKRLFKYKDVVYLEDLKEFKKNIHSVIEQLFNEKYKYQWAQVLLLKEQIISLLNKFIDIESRENSHFPCEIILMEKNFDSYINGIKLFGRIDMIIKNNKGIFILDFKSGSEKEVAFECIDDLFSMNSKMVYAFQLAFYGLLFLKEQTHIQHVFAENIYIKTYDEPYQKILSQKVKEEGKQTKYEKVNLKEILIKLEQSIADKINELFDTNVPFKQTIDIKNCEYCNFKLICRKK